MDEMNEMNFGSNDIVFRSSLRGYKKDDVNRYIANENKKFANVEKSYLKTIHDLRMDLDAAREEIALLNRHADQFEERFEGIEDEKNTALSAVEALSITNGEQKEEIDRLMRENEELRKELEDKNLQIKAERENAERADRCCNSANTELNELAEKNEELTVELKRAKNEIAELHDKLRSAEASKHTAITEQDETAATDLLYRAKSASEEMLRRAEESTSIIMEKARSEAAACRSDMLSVARDMITSVSDELHRSVDICMNDFVRGIRSVKSDSAFIADEVKRCGDDFGRRIERLQSDLDRTISEKLSEFDRKHGLFR